MVKALKESLAGCRAQRHRRHPERHLQLSADRNGKLAAVPIEDVLADAQRLGYAEADPTMDVGGFDAGHKLTHSLRHRVWLAA